MKKRLAALLAIMVWVGCAGVAISDDLMTNAAPAAPTSPPDHAVYLTGQEKVWSDFPKAPALDSAIAKSDLLITLNILATSTDDQKKDANDYKEYSIKLATDVIDSSFETKYKNIYSVLYQADKDGYFINDKLKKENARLRPYDQYPTQVTPLFPVKSKKGVSYSYPSGHASGPELQARLLSLLFPDKAYDLFIRARRVGESRVIAGVHYASDIEAGQVLGDIIFTELMANPKFKADLAAAAAKDGIPLKM